MFMFLCAQTCNAHRCAGQSSPPSPARHRAVHAAPCPGMSMLRLPRGGRQTLPDPAGQARDCRARGDFLLLMLFAYAVFYCFLFCQARGDLCSRTLHSKPSNVPSGCRARCVATCCVRGAGDDSGMTATHECSQRFPNTQHASTGKQKKMQSSTTLLEPQRNTGAPCQLAIRNPLGTAISRKTSMQSQLAR